VLGLPSAAIKAPKLARNDLQTETIAGLADLAGIEGEPLRQGQDPPAGNTAAPGQGAQRRVRGLRQLISPPSPDVAEFGPWQRPEVPAQKADAQGEGAGLERPIRSRTERDSFPNTGGVSVSRDTLVRSHCRGPESAMSHGLGPPPIGARAPTVETLWLGALN
jgi:hypothetical protein